MHSEGQGKKSYEGKYLKLEKNTIYLTKNGLTVTYLQCYWMKLSKFPEDPYLRGQSFILKQKYL